MVADRDKQRFFDQNLMAKQSVRQTGKYVAARLTGVSLDTVHDQEKSDD